MYINIQKRYFKYGGLTLTPTLAAARAYGISLSTEADLLFLADLAVSYNVYKYTKTIL